jgi:hypothetical protein
MTPTCQMTYISGWGLANRARVIEIAHATRITLESIYNWRSQLREP